MSITTLDQLVAGLLPSAQAIKGGGITTAGTGMFRGTWYQSPTAGSIPASGMSGAACNASTPGALQIPTPGVGQRLYVSKFAGGGLSASYGIAMFDRLWEQSGIVVTDTGAQTINSVAWPARDINQSSNGEGVYIAIECAATCGAATPDATLTYTNSEGTSGRTATLSSGALPSGFGVSNFALFGLADGDFGVRSVQSVRLTANLLSGTINLIAVRPVFMSCLESGQNYRFEDAISLMMPELWPDSCPMLAGLTSTSGTSMAFLGELGYAVG